jgi:hypothetical protein
VGYLEVGGAAVVEEVAVVEAEEVEGVLDGKR